MSFTIPSDPSDLLMMARLSEQCERYDEMLVCMKRYVKQQPELGTEERNLLSVAYKNVIGPRRATWRAIVAMEQKDEAVVGGGGGGAVGSAAAGGALLQSYKKQIEAELREICNDLLELLEKIIIPASQTDEAHVFYLKLKGDYHRYFAEVDVEDEQRKFALDAYTKATEYAESLKPTNPIRLGLALNFSVFHYEILKSQQRGCALAKKAFDDAVALTPDYSVQDEESAKEMGLILQLLRDNLTLWSEDNEPSLPDDGTKCVELDA